MNFTVTFRQISYRKCLGFILQKKLSCMFKDYRQCAITWIADMRISHAWESKGEAAAASLGRHFCYGACGQCLTGKVNGPGFRTRDQRELAGKDRKKTDGTKWCRVCWCTRCHTTELTPKDTRQQIFVPSHDCPGKIRTKHRKDVTTSGREQLCSVSVQLGAGVVHPQKQARGKGKFPGYMLQFWVKRETKDKNPQPYNSID